MILVDTSVWIDDLRLHNGKLRDRVDARQVLSHEMVIGELMCGNLPDRGDFLRRLKDLPAIPVLECDEVVALIERHKWMGRGIGYMDANLLGSVLACKGTSLWTNDRRLREIAEELGIAHIETGAA